MKTSQFDKNGNKANSRGSLSWDIYNQLKNDILSGEIEAGSLLSEAEIGKQFNVSRSPVRDALNRLACEKLVVALPQRGHLVRTVSVSEIVEAFRIRELLEVEAAKEAAKRVTEENIKSLLELLNENALAEEPLLWHFRIHTRIARLSGNRILTDFIIEILQLMQSVLSNHPGMVNNGKEDTEPERKVIEAIASGDPEVAKAAMQKHIREARDNMLQII